ncbi:hypothetical protein [Actinomycetospora sp. CA-053990]|uniref:hypothetical protein n=1 Tax=Actinomycetospora sp. CA-053990 TaxID=3239891 RepID=UPI003D89EFD1
MKIRVVYDQEGVIKAAAPAIEGSDCPIAKQGEQLDSFEVPEEIGEQELPEFITGLRVDVESNSLREA